MISIPLVLLAVIVVLGVVSLIASVMGLCAYFQEEELRSNICGCVGCFSLALLVVISALATGLYDWQAYAVPGLFTLGGVFFLVSSVNHVREHGWSVN